MVREPKSLPDNSSDGEKWQKLLEDIEASDVPLDMLKALRVHMKNGTSFVFPIKDWLEDGADPDKIEETILEWYQVKQEEIAGSDFVVDVNKLKNTIEAETKKTLRDL